MINQNDKRANLPPNVSVNGCHPECLELLRECKKALEFYSHKLWREGEGEFARAVLKKLTTRLEGK